VGAGCDTISHILQPAFLFTQISERKSVYQNADSRKFRTRHHVITYRIKVK